MIRGLFIDDGTKVHHLIFMCPKCDRTHGCLVDECHYNNGFTNVWAYKISAEADNIIELFPSFDNSKHCGWHGDYNWNVEVMFLQEGQGRNASTEKWLRHED